MRSIWFQTRRYTQGFTLIELLIVVAIIAILAAIAVPNFLEAQTRAKVSRVKSDQRTVSMALATYCIDTNKYPREYVAPDGTIDPDAAIALTQLTTPVAYLSSTSAVADPFVEKGKSFNRAAGTQYDLKNFFYVEYENFNLDRSPGADPKDPTIVKFKAYGISSLGPDHGDDGILCGPPMLADPSTLTEETKAIVSASVYDPTNGTVSVGDISRFGGEYPGAVAAFCSSIK